MSTVFAHPWLGHLFGDVDAQAIWSAERQLRHMLAFEAAWSRANGAAGSVDPVRAEHAALAIEGWTPDPALLGAGTAIDGVPVPALVRCLRAAAGDAAEAVHTGSTSQDVIDTATALCLRDTSRLLDVRLGVLMARLDDLTDRFGAGPLPARTRMQLARPVTAAVRLASWSAPLPRHRERLAQLRPRVEVLQLGGAAGDQTPFAARLVPMASTMSEALGIPPAASWQSARDGMAEYAGLLSLIAGGCAKIGQDIALMTQQGIDEVSLAGGGGSSAMAHKHNPIQAELLVTLGRYAATQLPALHHALIHEQERSGAAWALEWMTLAPLAITACRSLAVADELLGSVQRIGMAR